MFNTNINQSELALFVATLKNFTSNQMKKNPIPTSEKFLLMSYLLLYGTLYLSKTKKDQRISY